VLQDPDWPQYAAKMLQLQKKQEEVDHAGVPDVAALLRAARELPHLQLQGDAQDLRHELCSSPAAPAAAQAGAAPAPTHQVPLVSGLVLADGRVVSLPPAMQQQLLQQLAIMAGDPVTSAASAGTAGPPELQVLAGSSGGSGGSSSSITTIPGRARAQQQDKAQPAASSRGPLQLPSCSTATHSMAAEAACAAASTSGRGRGLRGENMRHKRCSGQYRETMYGLNGGASWADKPCPCAQRRAARPQDRNACAQDVSTYGPLVQAVQYAMREHGMSEEEALDRLDSMQADLGLTVQADSGGAEGGAQPALAGAPVGPRAQRSQPQ
jgi:hypothetical protein